MTCFVKQDESYFVWGEKFLTITVCLGAKNIRRNPYQNS